MLRSTSMKCTTILNVVSNLRDKICWTCQLAYMCTHIEYVVKKAKHLCMASYAVHSGVLRKLCPSYLLHHSGTNLKLNLAEWNTMCLTFDYGVNPPFFSLWAGGMHSVSWHFLHFVEEWCCQFRYFSDMFTTAQTPWKWCISELFRFKSFFLCKSMESIGKNLAYSYLNFL